MLPKESGVQCPYVIAKPTKAARSSLPSRHYVMPRHFYCMYTALRNRFCVPEVCEYSCRIVSMPCQANAQFSWSLSCVLEVLVVFATEHGLAVLDKSTMDAHHLPLSCQRLHADKLKDSCKETTHCAKGTRLFSFSCCVPDSVFSDVTL